MTLAAVRKIYSDLAMIVNKKCDEVVAALVKPAHYTQEQFETERTQIRKNAFKVTVTISGNDGNNAYGETLNLFSSEILPAPVLSIYMTNTTAYVGVFKQNPPDSFALLLDFGKPPIFDWSNIVSSPTTNNSNLSISGLDLTFVRSVEASIINALQQERPLWKFIHAPFVYDMGLWFIAMPYAIYLLSSAINWISAKMPRLEEFKFALYIYAFVIFLSLYRFLFQYIKWVFPLNVYAENEDSSAVHRAIIVTILLGLVGNVIYDFIK